MRRLLITVVDNDKADTGVRRGYVLKVRFYGVCTAVPATHAEESRCCRKQNGKVGMVFFEVVDAGNHPGM